jgi:hypothetical protein
MVNKIKIAKVYIGGAKHTGHGDETVGLARTQKDLVSTCSHPSNLVLG